jgi:cysteine-rich repeat protein
MGARHTRLGWSRACAGIVASIHLLGIAFAVVLASAAPARAAPCETIDMRIGAGSELDWGWNGSGHDQRMFEGATISLAVVERCSVANSICLDDADCPSGETCDPTCDCDNPAAAPECEIVGPVGPKRCIAATQQQCQVDVDCPGGQTCESFFGPPLPLSAEGTPTCVTSYLQEDLTGTVDLLTGRLEASAFLRSRLHLGIQLAKPCPRCGSFVQNPDVGDTFSCDGGPRNGQSCTVDGVSPVFGGTSFDCPPDVAANVSGVGLAIRLDRLTTEVETLQATLPCGGSLAALHPSNGGAVCLDTFASCSSNADCLRCTGAPTTACATNADCTGIGTCAAAPEHPIACGVYCHCGFCDGDPDSPCSSDAQCNLGETCAQGSGASQQLQGNKCTDLSCGLGGLEQCCSNDDPGCVTPTAKVGKCTLEAFRSCSDNSDCASHGAGTCVLSDRSCFENVLARTGESTPLGNYCVGDPAAPTCVTNADCAVGVCAPYTMLPTATALLCVPASASASIQAAAGTPGPMAMTLDTAFFLDGVGAACICGNGNVECVEQCDDGNETNADGCDNNCTVPTCGNGVFTPETGEVCDDGNLMSGDGCDEDCSFTACGNGITSYLSGEDCDDGNLIDADGCDSNCRTTGCGNGVTTPSTGEVCDDGNFMSGDGCDANCTITLCGNGIATSMTGEECDDGNTTSGDGCSSTCQLEIETYCELDLACKPLGVEGRSQIQIIDHEDPARDRIKWKWTKGTVTDSFDVGFPISQTHYALCLHDSGALVAAYDVPPSSARWEMRQNDVRYRDKAGTYGAVTYIKLRPGITGQARVEAHAGGTSLVLPPPFTPFQLFEQSPSVIVRLVNSIGMCWEAEFPVASTRKHTGERFLARVP